MFGMHYSNLQGANWDIENISRDVLRIGIDMNYVLFPIAVDTSLEIKAKFAEYHIQRKVYDINLGPNAHPFHSLLKEILFRGWQMEYLTEHFSDVISYQHKAMLDINKEAIVNAKKDLVHLWKFKIETQNTISQLQQLSMTQQIQHIVDTQNPFNVQR